MSSKGHRKAECCSIELEGRRKIEEVRMCLDGNMYRFVAVSWERRSSANNIDGEKAVRDLCTEKKVWNTYLGEWRMKENNKKQKTDK